MLEPKDSKEGYELVDLGHNHFTVELTGEVNCKDLLKIEPISTLSWVKEGLISSHYSLIDN